MADGDAAAQLAALQKMLDERTDTVRRMGAKLREARQQARGLQAERDAAAKERDDARSAADKALKDADPAPLKAELDRLRGEVRTGSHRAAFERLAREAGWPDDSLDFLFGHSGYKAEADAPDEAAIAAHLEALKEKPGFARIHAAAGPAPAPAPAGAGQGRRDVAPGKWRVTTDQLRDGAWAMENSARLREARKNGTLEVVEAR